MGKVVKLMMVTSANNNKYYHMNENFDGSTFTVEYGRVGANPQTRTYPISQWDKKYNAKVKKGYKDNTELFIVENEDVNQDTKKTDGFDSKRSNFVIDMVKKLQRWANKSVETNYTVSSENVTEKQVEKAQSVIDELVTFDLDEDNIAEFNNKLLEFFTIVPRKMKNVRNNLIDVSLTGDELKDRKNSIISDEQDTLDVMAGQVQLNKNTTSTDDTDTETTDTETETKDLISSSGLEFEEVTDDSILDTVKSMMQNNAHKLKKVFAVTNLSTQKLFDEHVNNAKNKSTELFWHGSRNENWWSIITSGLKIRPSNAVHTGSMFSAGVYFASKCQKSIGYSSARNSYWARGNSDEAMLAIYDVHIGNQKHIYKHDSSCYSITYDGIQKDNCDSVFAHGGVDLINDEFIIYNHDQSTIKYLILIES